MRDYTDVIHRQYTDSIQTVHILHRQYTDSIQTVYRQYTYYTDVNVCVVTHIRLLYRQYTDSMSPLNVIPCSAQRG